MSARNRLDLEPDTVERDLVKLVLTVVELLRQLMERQAVRRFDTGEMSEEQEERVGLTLMLLEDRMAASRALSKLPRDSSAVRVRNRDQVDGRPRGFVGKAGLSRIRFRSAAHRGELPGVTKSSW